MPPPTTKKKVVQMLKDLGVPRTKAPVTEFPCPLCKPGDSLGGGKRGGLFVVVGVALNGQPVGWDNLPVKVNKEGVEPEGFPSKMRVGKRRGVLRRHMQNAHGDRKRSAEYKSLASPWVYGVRFNYAGGVDPEVSAREKSARKSSAGGTSARKKSAPAKKRLISSPVKLDIKRRMTGRLQGSGAISQKKSAPVRYESRKR